MLAFVLDITQNKPANSKEKENDEVKPVSYTHLTLPTTPYV